MSVKREPEAPITLGEQLSLWDDLIAHLRGELAEIEAGKRDEELEKHIRDPLPEKFSKLRSLLPQIHVLVDEHGNITPKATEPAKNSVGFPVRISAASVADSAVVTSTTIELSDGNIASFQRSKGATTLPPAIIANLVGIDANGEISGPLTPSTPKTPKPKPNKHLLQAWKSLNSSKTSKEFRMPITPKIAPAYREYIENPMDLSTLKKLINKMDVKTWDEFETHIKLIVNNCISFNGKESPYAKEALGFSAFAEKIMQTGREREAKELAAMSGPRRSGRKGKGKGRGTPKGRSSSLVSLAPDIAVEKPRTISEVADRNTPVRVRRKRKRSEDTAAEEEEEAASPPTSAKPPLPKRARTRRSSRGMARVIAAARDSEEDDEEESD